MYVSIQAYIGPTVSPASLKEDSICSPNSGAILQTAMLGGTALLALQAKARRGIEEYVKASWPIHSYVGLVMAMQVDVASCQCVSQTLQLIRWPPVYQLT